MGEWERLRQRLLDRAASARDTLDEAGHPGVPLLIEIEEVLRWMDEEEPRG